MRLFFKAKPQSESSGSCNASAQGRHDATPVAPMPNRLAALRKRSRAGALALLVVLLTSASYAADLVAPVQPIARGSQLHCELQYGGSRQMLVQAASSDPYAAQTVIVAERFGFKASVLGSDDEIRSITLSVSDLKAAGSPIVQQARWSAPFVLTGDGVAQLTGWQLVYSSVLGREFRYGCTLQDGGGAMGQPSPTVVQQTAATAVAVADTDAVVRLAWLGDVMLADGPGRTIAHGGDPFKQVAALLKRADLRIANLECVIAAKGKVVEKPWTFLARPTVLPTLKRHIDVVSVANNHSGDFGADAFSEMLGRLRKAGLAYFGGGPDLRRAHQPLIVEQKGVRIALLGYNHFFPRRFEAGDHSAGVAWADEEQMAYDIALARQQADIVIPYMHWGQEHETVASARQRELARLLIDAGADAVVGSHPHVMQDTEIYRGKPIIYSLGNFVFDGFSAAVNNTGAILWLDITVRGVKHWHISTVRIDREGTPHPARQVVELVDDRLPK